VSGWCAQLQGWDVRTAVFLTLGTGQLGVAMALRAPRTRASRRRWASTWRERGLELAVVLALGVQLAGAAVPALHGLLGTERPSVAGLLVAVGLAAAPGAAVAWRRAVDKRARA
jgi:Ca2+-transporting ATPase